MTASAFKYLTPSVADFVRRRHKLLIDGQWREPQEGGRFPIHDPGTGQIVGEAAQGSRSDIDLAVAAARRAFRNWSRLPGAERGRLLFRLADRMEALIEDFAALESLDNGKPVAQAFAVDLPETIARFRYMAGWAGKINGETVQVGAPGEYHAYTVREPVGVVGQIVPWNFPITMAAYKVAPALAAGCAIVLKPAEQTPLTALKLGEIAMEVGFPAGVFNVVTGDGATGAALVEHPDVDKIAFTGSTAVGKAIARTAAATLKHVSLELGGKSPVVVFKDADIEAAARGAAGAIFYNQGQLCTAGSRLIVHETIADTLVARILDHARGGRIGHGLDPATSVGPLISSEQLERVQSYIEKGIAEGGVIHRAFEEMPKEGYYLSPVIFTGVTASSTVVREEIFGPVLSVLTFNDGDDLDAVAAMANDTEFGLAASVWTRDLGTAHRMASRIEAGTIWLNTHNHFDPALAFGGVKQSGYGSESGFHALELYTKMKAVLAPLSL